jgi:hypothetical protein
MMDNPENAAGQFASPIENSGIQGGGISDETGLRCAEHGK